MQVKLEVWVDFKEVRSLETKPWGWGKVACGIVLTYAIVTVITKGLSSNVSPKIELDLKML